MNYEHHTSVSAGKIYVTGAHFVDFRYQWRSKILKAAAIAFVHIFQVDAVPDLIRFHTAPIKTPAYPAEFFYIYAVPSSCQTGAFLLNRDCRKINQIRSSVLAEFTGSPMWTLYSYSIQSSCPAPPGIRRRGKLLTGKFIIYLTDLMKIVTTERTLNHRKPYSVSNEHGNRICHCKILNTMGLLFYHSCNCQHLNHKRIEEFQKPASPACCMA